MVKKVPQGGLAVEGGEVVAGMHRTPGEAVSLCREEVASPEVQVFAMDHKNFRIRLADTHAHRSSASMLIDKMYSWRGYTSTHEAPANPNLITLMASEDHDAVIGTISLSLDSSIGLMADEAYKDEIDRFRGDGRRICEFTKLAMNSEVYSTQVLASLFHVAYIYARYLWQCSDLFIEVNPRHKRFYERSLGFKPAGGQKNNARVGAPAVLLWLDLDYAAQQIQRLGGSGISPRPGKPLYSSFFSPHEERGITERLLSLG